MRRRHMRIILLTRFFFFKQKTAYEVRISDWSSDVCSSDLGGYPRTRPAAARHARSRAPRGWRPAGPTRRPRDRQSVASGKSVSVRVDLGGRRILKKKNDNYTYILQLLPDHKYKTQSSSNAVPDSLKHHKTITKSRI